jgi:beta propeller repeat protein
LAHRALLFRPGSIPRRAGAVLLALAALAPAVAFAGQPAPAAGPVVTLSGDGKADRFAPSAAGNTVAYIDCAAGPCNVWALNIVTRKAAPVAGAGHNQYNPATDGTTVVWQDGRNTGAADAADYTANFDLYAAALPSGPEFVVSSAPQLQGQVRVSGNVIVWADFRTARGKDDPDGGDIYMYDIAARREKAVVTLPSAQTRPATNGKVIVWADFRNEPDPEGFNGDIYAYDIATGREFTITKAPDLQTDPAIYGDLVVWQDYRNSGGREDYNADIYAYNLATRKEFAVTTAPGRQAQPTVAGDLIAWADFRNEPDQELGANADIYAYDVATGRELTVFAGPGAQRAPTIGGTTVVFESNPSLMAEPRGKWSIQGAAVSGVRGGTITPLAPPAALPGGASRTFPETGQRLAGIFHGYWEAHGGLPQQGYPISPVMGEVSDLDGKPYTVQYFERAVFEYHPENDAPYDVLLSQLGTFRYRAKYPEGAPNQRPNRTNGQLFAETGHWLGGRFREYWEQNGGLAQQGFPISDEFTEISELDGKTYTVQYFERAVFELHPENQAPYDVLLSQLGTFQYRQKYGR